MSSDQTAPFSVVADGVVLHVRLTPKGGRDAIDGIEQLSNGQSVLKARVRAVPEDGKANQALIKLLAAHLDCAPSAITLTAGATARLKTFRVTGAPDRFVARLNAGHRS